MTSKALLGLPLAMMIAGIGLPAQASPIADPMGDFLATYTGPQNGDLDILSAGVVFDGGNFRFTSTQNGAPGTSLGSLFVWGINRGGGIERLAPAPGATFGDHALFDAVAVLFPDGLVRVVLLPDTLGPPTSVTALAGAATVQGNSITALLAASLFPSNGFALADYRFTLWSRKRVDPTMDGTTAEIADFAPDASSFTATIPVSSTAAFLAIGLALAGASRSRRSGPPRAVAPR